MSMLFRGEIVSRHRLHRFAREDTDSIELALVEQHAPEALIVVGCGNETAASRWEKRLMRPTRVSWMVPHSQLSCWRLCIECREPAAFRWWHHKAGIHHAQWLEEALTQK